MSSPEQIPLTEDVYLTKDAVVTYKGRVLSKPERTFVLTELSDDFLRAFDKLPEGKQIAVRLRYGNNLPEWYRKEGRKQCRR